MSLHRDEERGHFALILAPRGPLEREVIGADLGPVLHVTMRGAHLAPDDARTLAGALLWWADRKHGAVADPERLAEVSDLLDLLEVEDDGEPATA